MKRLKWKILTAITTIMWLGAAGPALAALTYTPIPFHYNGFHDGAGDTSTPAGNVTLGGGPFFDPAKPKQQYLVQFQHFRRQHESPNHSGEYLRGPGGGHPHRHPMGDDWVANRETAILRGWRRVSGKDFGGGCGYPRLVEWGYHALPWIMPQELMETNVTI